MLRDYTILFYEFSGFSMLANFNTPVKRLLPQYSGPFFLRISDEKNIFLYGLSNVFFQRDLAHFQRLANLTFLTVKT
jgi:hypothetical protein